MDVVCPNVDRLSTCYSCNDQCLPPYRMCKECHLACGPCAVHRRRCECGREFLPGPHHAYDWLMAAMNHRCKYRAAAVCRDRPAAGDADGGCPDRWYTVQELRDHYRGSCSRNTYRCPVNGCGRACRVDTVAEHYESAHGPFEEGRPDDMRPEAVQVFARYESELIKKVFNGYFVFTVGPKPRGHNQCPTTTMRNINPADMLKYEYQLRKHDHNLVIFTVIIKKNVLAENHK